MAQAISVRLPEELIRALNDLAESTDRSKTYLVREAIESYIEDYADYRQALDRLLDKDDEIIDSSELRKRLAP